MRRGLAASLSAVVVAAGTACSGGPKPLRVLYLGDSARRRAGGVLDEEAPGGAVGRLQRCGRRARDEDAPYRTVEEFTTDYKALIAHVRSLSPHARFVCVSVWRPKSPPNAPTADNLTGFKNAAAFDAVIKAACPGEYVNIQRFAHPPNLGADEFHPSPAAHKLIAHAILNALKH